MGTCVLILMKTWLRLSTTVDSSGRDMCPPPIGTYVPVPVSPGSVHPPDPSRPDQPATHLLLRLSSPTRNPISAFSGGLPKKSLLDGSKGFWGYGPCAASRPRPPRGGDSPCPPTSPGPARVPLNDGGDVWPARMSPRTGLQLAGSPLSLPRTFAYRAASKCPGRRDARPDARPVAVERDPWGWMRDRVGGRVGYVG